MPTAGPDRLPPPAPARVAWIKGSKFAHRGLHDKLSAGPVEENSMPAFAAAINGGYGIECDVQLSADNRAVVFHDYTLDRLTHMRGPVKALSAAQLGRVSLRGQNGYIPSLADLLELTGSRQPLLIEIKVREAEDIVPLCRSVAEELETYQGPVAVMGFEPLVPAWFAEYAPHIVRGLVVSETGPENLGDDAMRNRAIIAAEAEFLAWNIDNLPSAQAALWRDAGWPLASWTVRSPAEQKRASEFADAPIFER